MVPLILLIFIPREREGGFHMHAIILFIVYFSIVFSILASHEAGRVAREYICEHADMRICESAIMRNARQGCWDEIKRRCSELSGFAWMDRRIYSFFLCSIGVIYYDPLPPP